MTAIAQQSPPAPRGQADEDVGPALPAPRGPLSAVLFERLVRPAGAVPLPDRIGDDPLTGEDLHVALYACYELHYRGLAGVADGWEWDPALLAFRRRLETAFEEALRAEAVSDDGVDPAEVGDRLAEVVSGDGPSLSAWMEEYGTLEQFREFAIHRSAYQLKEADPHTWALPRLWGSPKSAIVEIQADEYGEGVPGQSHAELFAATMTALGLDTTYGAYVDRLPGTTLATVNLVSMFGLHRRLRAALVGHLAAFEMTSVTPMSRYSRALGRLGLGSQARRFYDVHVEADVRHAAIAGTAMAGGLAAQQPALAADILFGARALSAVEGRLTAHLLDSWARERSSLRP
ncbi:MAG: iron-containing redox enzyme family protein [Acidimicrobiia bacterium]